MASSIKLWVCTVLVVWVAVVTGVDMRLSLLDRPQEGSSRIFTHSTTTTSYDSDAAAPHLNYEDEWRYRDVMGVCKERIGTAVGILNSSSPSGDFDVWERLANDGIMDPPPTTTTKRPRPLLKSSNNIASSPMKNWKLIHTILHGGVTFIKTKAHQIAKAALGMLIKLDTKSLNKGFQLVMKRAADVLGWAIKKAERFMDSVLGVLQDISRGNPKKKGDSGGKGGGSGGDENKQGDNNKSPNIVNVVQNAGALMSLYGGMVGQLPLIGVLFNPTDATPPPLPLAAHHHNEHQRYWVEMAVKAASSSSPICVLSSSENTPYRPQPPFMYLHSLLTGTVTKAVLEELVFPSSPTNASLVWSRSFNTPPPQSAPLSPLTPPYRFAKVVMNLSMMILEFTVFMFGAVWFAWEVAHFSSFVSNTLAKLRALQNHRQFAIVAGYSARNHIRGQSVLRNTVLITTGIISLSVSQLLIDYTSSSLNCVTNGLLLAAFACIVRTETCAIRQVVRNTNEASIKSIHRSPPPSTTSTNKKGSAQHHHHQLPIPFSIWPTVSLAFGCSAALFSGQVYIAIPFVLYSLGSALRINKARNPASTHTRILAGLSALLSMVVVAALALIATAPFASCDGGVMEILAQTMLPSASPTSSSESTSFVAILFDVMDRVGITILNDPLTRTWVGLVWHISVVITYVVLGGVATIVALRKATGIYRREHDDFVATHTTPSQRKDGVGSPPTSEAVKIRNGLRPEALLAVSHAAAITIDTIITLALFMYLLGDPSSPSSSTTTTSREATFACCGIAWLCIQWMVLDALSSFNDTPGVGLSGVSKRYLVECQHGAVWGCVLLVLAHMWVAEVGGRTNNTIIPTITSTSFTFDDVTPASSWMAAMRMLLGTIVVVLVIICQKVGGYGWQEVVYITLATYTSAVLILNFANGLVLVVIAGLLHWRLGKLLIGRFFAFS